MIAIKYFTSIVLLLTLAAIANATDLKLGLSGEKTFKLNDKVGANEMKFVSNAPLEDITGNVESKLIVSDFKFDPANIESATGKISFRVDGMETGISRRDKHLQSSDWLDAKKFPNIVFELEKLSNVKIVSSDAAQGRAVINADAIGTYSMHGKTKNLTIQIKLTYVKESEATKKRASGNFIFIEGKFDIALKDFDVKGAKGIVGSKVGETIKTNFQLFYNDN